MFRAPASANSRYRFSISSTVHRSAADAFSASVITGTRRCGSPLYPESSTRFGSIKMSRNSSGRQRKRSDAIRALTITLFPEPVAPAISRCGILVRSVARAAPATSRPSAKVSPWLESANSTSSKMLFSPTTLLSRFGISMPTTERPGIGASIRIDRAESAIARSSASASILLTRTEASGSSSYWVTTGPALIPTTCVAMPKLASFDTMI